MAGRRDGSADAILVDAFVGARVPQHLATLEALHDLARVVTPAGAVAINVVDAGPSDDARSIAAGLGEAFRHVAALGAGPVLRGRRGGNIVLVAGHGELPLERLRTRAAADPSPAGMLTPDTMGIFCGGAVPWRD